MSQHTAHVATFYSFKGGVGRSLLLANTGWRLAERQRVLLWDLDIEAPGLHHIPALKPASVKRGFFEWLDAWKGAGQILERKALSKKEVTSLRRLIQPVPRRPHLSILPAFGDGSDFARLYAEGPWRRLLVDEPSVGLALFDAVLAVLGEQHDHILIDSRTGITDIGGFLTALLPHATILVGGYGHQSLHGTLHVRTALEPAVQDKLVPRQRLGPGSALQLVHVISPVPEDVAESAERRRIWAELFHEIRPIEIPFDRRLLWSEQLLVESDPEGATAKAYGAVVNRLTALREQLLVVAEEVTTSDARYPEGASHRDLDGARRILRAFAFEGRVRRLLELHGYTVEPAQLTIDRGFDLLVRTTAGLDEQVWVVLCKSSKGPVAGDVLKQFAASIGDSRFAPPGARGMVVAQSFTPAAMAFAVDHPSLRIWTINELERRLFDPRSYLESIVSAFEQGPLGRTYVSQKALLEGRPAEEAKVDLLEHAVAWATGEGPRLWLLLGDYGTGKSAFFQRFAAELARRALADPEAPFPLAIDLKEYPNATSAETLIFEHLRRKAPGFRGDPAALLHLLAAGRCVLLLDAFDEMGLAAAGRNVEEQFRELARLTGEEPLDPARGNRLLVTCRTHFFRDQQQVKDTAGGQPATIPVSEDSSLGQVARRFNAEIDEVCLFEEEQINEFLEKHLGAEQAVRARDFIRETYDLPTLAPRPVLLELIVKSLPTLWREGANRVTPASLYEVYTRQWLEDRSGRNLQTPPPLRHRLLTLLAVTLWRRDDRQIHHHDLLTEVRRLATHFPGLDWERVDVELRTAAFLVRSPDGYYRFSHKSFLEYFLARGLWDALGERGGGGDALAVPPLSPEVGEFFWQLAEEGRSERLESLRNCLRSPFRAGASENALRLAAWSVAHLGAPFEVTGAQLAGAQLDGENLRELRLPQADLSGAHLSSIRAAGIDLTGGRLAAADLTEADLSRASFRDANVDGASLRMSVCDGTDFSNAVLTRADLTSASGDGTLFDGSDLRQSRLDASVWTHARFREALLEGAETTDWLLVGERDFPRDCNPGRLTGLELRIDNRVPRKYFWSAAFSPDGRLVALGGQDGVHVCDVASGERIRLLDSRHRVFSVAFSPDGGQIASASGDCVQLWDAATGAWLRKLPASGEAVVAVAFSPDGPSLAAVTAGEVRLWDLTKGTFRALANTSKSLHSVVFSPEGRQVACAAGKDGLSLWDTTSGEVQSIPDVEQRDVRAVAYSPDGCQLAIASMDGIRLHDLQRQSSRAIEIDRAVALAFSPDGARLACGGTPGGVQILDSVTGERLRVIDSNGSGTVVFSPDGLQVLSAGGQVVLTNPESGRQRRVLASSNMGFEEAVFTPEGQVEACGSGASAVAQWDVTGGGGGGVRFFQLETERSLFSLSISNTGQLAVGSGSSVFLSDRSRRETFRRIPGNSVWFVALSPDGQLVATGAPNGICLWDVPKGEELAVIGKGDWWWSVAFSPDGRYLASSGYRGRVSVWEIATKNVRVLSPEDESAPAVWSVAFSPDGRNLAAGGDAGTWVWDLESGSEVLPITSSTKCVAFAPDGRQLASGGPEGIRLLDLPTGKTSEPFGAGAWRFAFSPDGARIAAVGTDAALRLYEVATGELVATLVLLEDSALVTIPGGWFARFPRSAQPDFDPRHLRLLVAPRSSSPERNWRVLPLGGLARWLESPEKINAALAGECVPPPELPGAAESE